MRVQEGLCVLGASYLICQDLTLFYGLLDLRNSECDVVSLYGVCFSVNVSFCFVCCVFDSVCELFVVDVFSMRVVPVIPMSV